MSLPLLIIIILFGLLLVTLEIVALPGGVAGICGGIFTIVGIWITYVQYGCTAGNIALISSIVVCVALLTIFMKSKTWRRVSLNDAIDSKANDADNGTIHVGDRGVTLSRLAPAGKALIEGQTVEVHTVSEFVDPNKAIEVTEIEGYMIMVREADGEI